jgi:hypothetical protein
MHAETRSNHVRLPLIDAAAAQRGTDQDAKAEYWRDKVQAPVAQIIAAKLP